MRQPRNAQQIADNPYNLPEPIIEDILNEGELAILSAPYDSFKSYFSLEMAYSILTGEPFLNRFEVKNLGPVYFFELEIHRGVFDGRINNLKMTREQRENFWVDYDQFRFDGLRLIVLKDHDIVQCVCGYIIFSCKDHAVLLSKKRDVF